MNRATRTLVAGVAAATLLSGCSSSADTPRPVTTSTTASSTTASSDAGTITPQPYPARSSTRSPASRLPRPTDIDQTNATAVALAGARAVQSSDTLLDADPNATARRAASWLTPAFSATVRDNPPVAAPGATWNTWSSHSAYLVVTTRLGGDEHPRDTSTTAYRQIVAAVTPLGRDHWRGPPFTVVMFVALQRSHAMWRIAAVSSSGGANSWRGRDE